MRFSAINASALTGSISCFGESSFSEVLQQRQTFRFCGGIALAFTKLDQRYSVFKLALKARQRPKPLFELGAFTHDLLRGVVSFQRLGSSTLAFSSARRRVDVSTSKMPPQQSHGLLDGFDKRFGFGAHDWLSCREGRGATRLRAR